MTRAGGRRFYRPSDITILINVRRLLHDEGLSIRAVQELHAKSRMALAPTATKPPPLERGERLGEILVELTAAKSRLDALLNPF